MGSEQQFCLRWNNHQSTLVAVFDTLLESGTLVDCTLAAEGQYLKAHKVVLSACSPYFELLLSQHYEKHPIVILKDVKFQELKAMMDYMYRGEVNISQDQLGALLKAAESLQIKGLSDSGGGNERDSSDKRHGRKETTASQPPPARSPPSLPLHSSGLTIEHRRNTQQSVPPVVELPEDSPPPAPMSRMGDSREGSVSPIPRKRKKHRRRSSTGEEGAQGLLSMTDAHDQTSSSCELPPQSQAAPAASIPAIISPVVPTPSTINKPPSEPVASAGPEEQTEPEMTRSSLPPPTQPNISSGEGIPPDPETVQKMEPASEMLLEPKSEYLDDTMNEDSVEDLTQLDDVDDMDQAKPGPSHGGEGSSNQGSGFAPWHVTAAERSTDEVFMAAQEAVGAHRDSQGELSTEMEAESQSQSENEAETQSECEAACLQESDSECVSDTEAKNQSEIETESQSEMEAEPQSEIEGESQSEIEVEPQVGNRAVSESEAEYEPEIEAEAMLESGAGTETDSSETEVEPENREVETELGQADDEEMNKEDPQEVVVDREEVSQLPAPGPVLAQIKQQFLCSLRSKLHAALQTPVGGQAGRSHARWYRLPSPPAATSSHPRKPL